LSGKSRQLHLQANARSSTSIVNFRISTGAVLQRVGHPRPGKMGGPGAIQEDVKDSRQRLRGPAVFVREHDHRNGFHSAPTAPVARPTKRPRLITGLCFRAERVDQAPTAFHHGTTEKNPLRPRIQDAIGPGEVTPSISDGSQNTETLWAYNYKRHATGDRNGRRRSARAGLGDTVLHALHTRRRHPTKASTGTRGRRSPRRQPARGRHEYTRGRQPNGKPFAISPTTYVGHYRQGRRGLEKRRSSGNRNGSVRSTRSETIAPRSGQRPPRPDTTQTYCA